MKLLGFFIWWLSGSVVSTLTEILENKEESIIYPTDEYGLDVWEREYPTDEYRNENLLGWKSLQNRSKTFNALNPAIPVVGQYIAEEIDRLQNTDKENFSDYKLLLSSVPRSVHNTGISSLTDANGKQMKMAEYRFSKFLPVIFNPSLLNYLRTTDLAYNLEKAGKKEFLPDGPQRLRKGFVQEPVQKVSNHYVPTDEVIDTNPGIQVPEVIDTDLHNHGVIETDLNYKEHVDFADYFRSSSELGFINVPKKAFRSNSAYLLRKDAQTNAENDFLRPEEPYPKYNASKSVELDETNYNLENVQSDITDNLTKFLRLQHAPNFQNQVINLPYDFPVSQFDYQYNQSHGIQQREILKYQEKYSEASTSGLKFFLKLSEQENENRTGSLLKDFQLHIIHNLKKRETVLKVSNKDVTPPNHKTKKPLTNNQTDKETFKIGKQSEFGRTYEIPKFRPSSIRYFFPLIPVRKVDKQANVMPSSVEGKIKTFTDCYAHKPVQVAPFHSSRVPVQLDSSHNMRKPVQLGPSHSLRTPVELHRTHNLQKPAQVDPSHDLRKPVKLEPTHNLRKPVKSMESHDLRWPVMEEPDHNMQNPITQTDAFSKGEEIIKGNMRKGSRTGVVDDPLHELLYEDEFLMVTCSQGKTFSSGPNPGNTATTSKYNYKRMFNESLKACGIPSNHSTEEVFRRERQSTKWPWMVSLQQHIFDRFWHKCAGSLLNNLWVITAAHCVESRPKWDFLLQLGMDGESLNYIERFVDRMSIHPKFNILNLDHDIALLRMDNPVTFQASIAPVCLPWRPDEIENKKAVALGWKIAAKRNVTDDLSREKTVPVLTNKECEVMFSETGSSENIQKSFLCASFENEHEVSCVGDSGGPLVIFDGRGRWTLAGLYSWGKSCRTPNQPEVYVRISRYAEWIEDAISCYEGNINLRGMD